MKLLLSARHEEVQAWGEERWSSWPVSTLEKVLKWPRTGSRTRGRQHMNERITVACRRCTGLAEGTASVELASGAERTTTAKPEALEPEAYGEAACVRETPARQGQARVEPPLRKGERGIW